MFTPVHNVWTFGRLAWITKMNIVLTPAQMVLDLAKIGFCNVLHILKDRDNNYWLSGVAACQRPLR